MPTYWHKQDWWPSDLDRTNPHMPSIVPGALPPGIYCEDEAAFRALQRGARTRGATFDPGIHSGLARLDGMAVYVATPEQAQLLGAVSSTEPPPPAPDSTAGMLAKIEARMRELGMPADPVVARGAVNLARSVVGDGLPPRPVMTSTEVGIPEQAPPPATRHPFRGANRQQRRAAEAKRRRA